MASVSIICVFCFRDQCSLPVHIPLQIYRLLGCVTHDEFWGRKQATCHDTLGNIVKITKLYFIGKKGTFVQHKRWLSFCDDVILFFITRWSLTSGVKIAPGPILQLNKIDYIPIQFKYCKYKKSSLLLIKRYISTLFALFVNTRNH